MEEWLELHKTQPHGMIFYTATPGDPMPPMRLARGFLVDMYCVNDGDHFACHGVAESWWYWSRVMFVLALGVFAIMSVHLVNGVFHDMPM